MVDKSELLPFIEGIATEFHFAAIVPVSAKLDKQLDTLLEAIRNYLPLGDPSMLQTRSPTATNVSLLPNCCAKKYSASQEKSYLIQ